MISPLVTVLADIITLRLLPPFVACVMLYLFVNLNDAWHAKVTFFATMLLMSVLGVLMCRCIAALTLASFKTSEAQARSSMVSTSVSDDFIYAILSRSGYHTHLLMCFPFHFYDFRLINIGNVTAAG